MHDDSQKISAFEDAGYECHGGLTDLLNVADIVIDCSPGKVGASNLDKYKSAGVKWIFQGGEKHAMTGMSYTSSANHAENLNVEGTRVVSCNTTGLSRTLVPLFNHCGSLSVECTMIRRAADPGDSSKGPINAIKPVAQGPITPRSRRYDSETRNFDQFYGGRSAYYHNACSCHRCSITTRTSINHRFHYRNVV